MSVFVSQVYVLKRPYVDEFLQRMGELFECVLFTASLAKVLYIRQESEINLHILFSTSCFVFVVKSDLLFCFLSTVDVPSL